MHFADSGSSRWLNRFIWALAACTLFLICSGGMVTSKGVGLAVPDWPTTFGYNMFLFPFSHWVEGVFFEHTHRLIASAVGFLTIVLAVWLWRDDPRPWVRWLGLVALAAVIVQGVLGGLRVTMLKDEIGIFHACLAHSFLCLLVFIGVLRSAKWQELRQPSTTSASRIAAVTVLLIFVQLALGATMRHQHLDLAILDFPLAYGRLVPDTDPAQLAAINRWRDMQALSQVTAGNIWLQMAHRIGAVAVAAGVIGYAVALRRRRDVRGILLTLSGVWILLLALQITLGAWTIWSNKAADIATAHVAVGATMLALGVAIYALSARVAAPAATSGNILRPVEATFPERVHAA